MSRSAFDYIFPSPIGQLGLSLSAQGVRCLSYVSGQQETPLPSSGLGMQVVQQIQEYFQLTRATFDLPLDITGTPFQKKVWQAVAGIAFGESQTYGEIANAINSGPRAVGNACRHNPVPIIIPCHRVVKKNALGGYCGSVVGREIQQKDWLLRHEVQQSANNILFSDGTN